MRPLLVATLLLLTAIAGSAQKAPAPASLAADRVAADRARAALEPVPALKPVPAHAPAAPASFETLVRPFLAENCYECHGNKKQKKEINFETVESAATLSERSRSLGRRRAAAARP